MAVYQLADQKPVLGEGVYVDELASVIGNVKLAKGCTVWCGAVLRGDDEQISVGENSNVQDNSVLHADVGFPVRIGERVTVGHMVVAHGCEIGDGSLIGMGAVILNGAKIGKNCLVGAGALITEGKEFADNQLILGSPAKAVRTLSPEHLAMLSHGFEHYVTTGQRYLKELKRIA